jgi:outer membrane immunogenic protein
MTKMTLGAVVAAATLIGSLPVLAADLTQPLTYKAPPPAPIYNWSGLYIGAHLGGAWESRGFSRNSVLFPALDADTITSSGVTGGGQIGYNWQFTPNWLAGIEADVSGANLSGSLITPSAPPSPATVSWTDNTHVFGTLRGRLGYVANNWLFYGTGGLAWDDSRFARNQLVAGPASPPAGLIAANTLTTIGWAAGAGVEWGFARNWTARIEYLHLDVDGGSYAFTSPSGAAGINTFTINPNHLRIDTVRVGANYLFN